MSYHVNSLWRNGLTGGGSSSFSFFPTKDIRIKYIWGTRNSRVESFKREKLRVELPKALNSIPGNDLTW